MTRTEIISEMTRRGYTHVETYGGPVPLEKWRPYNGVNGWQGRISGANEVYDIPRDDTRPHGLVLGVWTFTRYASAECRGCLLTFGYDAALGRPFYCDRCEGEK